MSKCSRCIYGFIGGFGSWGCEYINVTGEKRGCPAGDNCIRYVSRKSASRKPAPIPMKHKKTFKEDNSMAKAKLTEEQKRSIVTESQAGAMVGELAAKYNIGKSSIYNVLADYKEHGKRSFTADTDTDAEKEPETVGAVTDSEQEISTDIPADIIPDIPENVKPVSEKITPLIPESVIHACRERRSNLQKDIEVFKENIDDWNRQIEELNEFIELARIANPWEVQHES